jgi:PTS system nitrogen regulatory IIA component
MRIKDLLQVENVVLDLAATTRDDVISGLVDLVVGQVPVTKEKLVRILIERENQAPTAMSGGVAVPHGRLTELDQFILAIGRSRDGVNFGEREEVTKIFFLLIAPAGDTVTHLKVLARIARILRSESFRQDIMAAESARQIYERVIAEDEKI